MQNLKLSILLPILVSCSSKYICFFLLCVYNLRKSTMYNFLRESGSELRGTKRTQDHGVSSLAGCAGLCAAVAVSLSSQVNDCSGRGWSMMTSRSGPGTTQGRQGRGAKFVLILTVSWQSPTRLEGDNTPSRSVTVSRRVVARCHFQTVSAILLRERTSKQCISILRAMSLFLNINSSKQ